MTEIRKKSQMIGEDTECFGDDVYCHCKNCNMKSQVCPLSDIVASISVKLKSQQTMQVLIEAVRISHAATIFSKIETRVDKIQEHLNT